MMPAMPPFIIFGKSLENVRKRSMRERAYVILHKRKKNTFSLNNFVKEALSREIKFSKVERT